MAELVIHQRTKQQLRDTAVSPPHALLLSGSAGIGKQSLVYELTAQLMNIPLEKVPEHQYVRIISAGKDKSISIDKVRELEQFLSRKVLGDGQRVVIVEDAHLLGAEAQNALLKTLEEPPLNTVILLTVAHEQALLPTIRSRVQALAILKPEASELKAYFQARGHDATVVSRAHAMSGGLPGLMTAILDGQDEHPLIEAAGVARQIAQGSMFERLAMVDGLSKDREKCFQVLSVLQQMARVSMRSGNMADTWQRILKASHQAIGELLGSGQPKLVLTNLMLNL